MFKRYFFLYMIVLGVSSSIAQNVGIGTISPHPSARLDIYSQSRGLLIPRLTTAQRDSITAPAHGLLVFNIDSFTIEMYDSISGRWLVVADTGGCAPPCTPPPAGTQPTMGVAVGTKTPHHSSILTIKAKYKGLLLPRLTLSQRNSIASPAQFLIVSRKDSAGVDIYDGSQWLPLLRPLRCATPCTATGGAPADTFGIVIGAKYPHHSAVYEIRDQAHGVLIPRLTVSQRQSIPSPAHALLIFNVDSFCLEAFDSISQRWKFLSCPKCPVPNCLIAFNVPTWLCISDTVTVVANGCSQAHQYTWHLPSGWNYISGQGTDTLRLVVGNTSGYLKVKECVWCGCSPYDSVFMQPQTAPPTPTVTQLPSNPACPIDTIVLIATASGATSWTWTVPSGWTALTSTTNDTLKVIAPGPGATGTFKVKACNPCGCDSTIHTVSTSNNILSPQVSISGPTNICLPDTIIYKASHSSGHLWQWWYPSSWQVLAQGGDSIVLIPDTADGSVIVQVCDTVNCSCDMDTVFVNADTCISFCIAIGGPNDDYGESIIQTNDGGYAIAGYTNSFGQGNNDIYIVKLDANGNIQWTRTIGGPADEFAYSIVQTNDGGYAVAGRTSSFSQIYGYADVYIVKLDSNGNVQWTRSVGGRGIDYGYSIIQTNDGGYAIAGTSPFGQGNVDVYIIKLDGNGNLQWTRTIGGTAFDQGYSIIQTNDGGYAITGYTFSFGSGGSDVYVVKLDAGGNLQWTITVGGTNNDYGNSIIQTIDGGYAVVGYTESFGQGLFDVYIIKLDDIGNLQWTRTVGGSGDEYGVSIAQTFDGGYVIAGTTASYDPYGDVYVIKIDANGSLQWTRVIGGADWDEGMSIVQTIDGGYVITGLTSSFSQGGIYADIYVVKLDANGNLAPCPGGCQMSSGGASGSGGTVGSGGIVGSGGTTSSGGIASSGGTLLNICP